MKTPYVSTDPRKKVELLLPVGTMEMAQAAIHNGADAIFIGVPGFNARGRSHDFEIDALREIIELCHLYDVKVNLAFNVVIFQEELPRVVDLLQQILPLKPDAIIVQDLGLVRLIREMAPTQRVHASTQMTVTNHEAIQLLEDLDIQRFVVGRENSLEEIKKIRANTTKELETFVHGALCVSYSGQCFTSESIGGRSANRGQCAQSCRFSYELHVDGEKRDLGNKKYLVSPKDFCGIDEVPELVAGGVDCFKVEGRLKNPDYVATAASAYRRALDGAQQDEASLALAKKNMGVAYSRGFFSGWLHGVNHQKLVGAEYSAHRGHEIGVVIDVFRNTVTMQVSDSLAYDQLQPGDGLVWAKGDREQGGFIYGLDRLPKSRLRVEFARDLVLNRELVGAVVYQNHDKELKKQVSQSVSDKNLKKRLNLTVEITLAEGQPLRAKLSDGLCSVEGCTELSATPAINRGLSDTQLEEEFGSLTGSLYKLSGFNVARSSEAALFLPHKEYKALRQKLVADLTEKRHQAVKTLGDVLPAEPVPENLFSSLLKPSQTPALSTSPRLNVLLREKGQVQDLVDAVAAKALDVAMIDTVTLDFEFGRDYQASVELLRTLGVKVGLATTRILKPQEYRNLKVLADLAPDSILVRNLGALHYLTKEYPLTRNDLRSQESQHDHDPALAEASLSTNTSLPFELRGDFSLNVTNHLTADYLLQKGLSSLCVSYDLNHHQVRELLMKAPANHLEVTIFQYMPSFHMEHCVFAAFLSEGTSYRDCGKPCEKHSVRLKDQFQNWHEIKADQECRNTMFNARSQSASRYLSEWMDFGLGYVRYEALKERGPDLITKLSAHMDLLQNKINDRELIERIGSIESYGLSEGPLSREREYQSRKKI